MLTADEKDRIQAEELFRLEIRRDLEATKPSPTGMQRLWSWLNSSFGLWLLSSVVLAGLTTAYTHYRNQRDQELKSAEARQRLDTEIAGRMFEATKVLAKYSDDIAQGTTGPPSDIYGTVVGYLDNSITESGERQDLSIYPEFRGQNFQSLLIEYSSLDGAEKSRARDALNAYFHFKDLASDNDKIKDPDQRRAACLKAVADAEQTLKGLMTGRWQMAL